MNHRPVHPAIVSRVEPDSIAAELGFEPGDALLAINGERPRDLIDYRFLCADEVLTLEVLGKDGQTYTLEIEKEADDDLGLEFTTALFDGLLQCNNRCPFCFIDQQPPGKRQSLYAKDDDYRLSFLYGSYLTLTNLTAPEWQRIARLRLSPLYVSVHATVASVRQRLLKNPRAGEILRQLAWFQEQRLQLHAQVVVCPGINDGQCLEQTLRDLASFYHPDWPTVLSVAVVPVGLTRFRPADDELVPVTPDDARTVLRQVQALQEHFQRQWGTPFVWLADEWFLIAGRPLPPATHYQDYPQLSNGVGTIRLFLEEFAAHSHDLPTRLPTARHLSWVVGNAVGEAFQPLVTRLNQIQNLRLDLYPLASDYWGQAMTVTGLLTGHDLIYHLQGKPLGDRLLLPSIMLKHDEAVFLDDLSLETVADALQVPIQVVSGGAAGLIAACTSS
ncbi:TIGR03279 family radical SAM protein [Synechococcus sp. PCC 6717]|jgi:putative radical SAM enzyme (TIGR03279 family)|uniref:Fe-S oxidoreductase n=1 Tax=Parathermosynechococcus lividus PCC 6715 TaxID=1917166 RepID=A0A2D2PZ78_PARLV|nr:TIGR03279 family radical SAM protein [Thermostichus lividus]ATS17559.1 Fe-S oxidoreductase [Thermostichus lividus PCC 6715]MCI3280946.1 TIGR03279 family radical SAM protein [Synechococcus sp. PCC 6717]